MKKKINHCKFKKLFCAVWNEKSAIKHCKSFCLCCLFKCEVFDELINKYFLCSHICLCAPRYFTLGAHVHVGKNVSVEPCGGQPRGLRIGKKLNSARQWPKAFNIYFCILTMISIIKGKTIRGWILFLGTVYWWMVKSPATPVLLQCPWAKPWTSLAPRHYWHLFMIVSHCTALWGKVLEKFRPFRAYKLRISKV